MNCETCNSEINVICPKCKTDLKQSGIICGIIVPENHCINCYTNYIKGGK